MAKSLFVCFAAALLFSAAAPAQSPTPVKKSALDKATLEAYVRHLYVMDSRVNMQVSDPKPSELAGFVEETVHAWAGTQSQDLKFLISKDGSKILQASVFDVNQNPFKADLDKLKTQGTPAEGTAGAPVVIVEFSDFECPYCKQEAELLHKNLLSTFPTQVRLYFKTFPLESLHPWAKAAAVASRCVYKQNADAFWTYHDWIFEHQAEVTGANLKSKVLEWAKDVKGVDATQLGRCMDTNETEDQVKAEMEEGRALEVNSTPTLFINGRRIASTIDWPSLKSIIDYEIEYQKVAKDAGDDCGCQLQLKMPGMTTAAPPGMGVKK